VTGLCQVVIGVLGQSNILLIEIVDRYDKTFRERQLTDKFNLAQIDNAVTRLTGLHRGQAMNRSH
jgi:hypothetical protein